MMIRVTNKWNYLLLIPALLFIYWEVCNLVYSSREADIIELPFKKVNPVCYVFPVSVSTVRDSMLQWTKKDPSPRFKGFLWQPGKDGETHFHLWPVTSSGLKSYIYRYRKRQDKINAGREVDKYQIFDIYLHSVSDDSTLVAVYLGENCILTGVKFWTNICFKNNYVPKEKPVPSSTIEEYELLRYIGKRLGYLKGMPYVKYPEPLSREEILKTFGEENPFTYGEMFE